MTKRLLFDLEATQPNLSGKRHGGGKYGEIVLQRIVERSLPVMVYYNSTKWLNQETSKLLKERHITSFDVATCNLEEVILQNGIEKLYTPLLNKRTEKVTSLCKVIATVHGLRTFEVPEDPLRAYYTQERNQYGFLPRKLAYCIWPDLRRKRLQRALDREEQRLRSVDFLTVSTHSAYSLKTFFPRLEFDTRKVFYSPSTVTRLVGDRKYQERYFLLVNGNRWEKNALRVIMALDRLFSSGQLENYSAYITGASSSQAYRWNIQNPDRFKFLSYVDEDELSQLYHDSYCLIYPTLNEGFGYPPLEAMVYGVPVIASSFSSIQEVCQSAVLYTNPFSVEEIMNRVLMMETKEIWEEYSVRGRKRYAEVKERQDADLDRLIDYIYKQDSL